MDRRHSELSHHAAWLAKFRILLIHLEDSGAWNSEAGMVAATILAGSMRFAITLPHQTSP
jgi:hypothetical protein